MKIKHNLYLALIVLFVLLTFVQPLHAEAVQICRNSITPTTPTRDFTFHGDGTVTHHKTGLMWMRCALGQNWNGADCTGSAYTYSWQDAHQIADDFNFAGHGDWRLPNIKELGSIVEQACLQPAINRAIFPDKFLYAFWTATPYAGDVRYAWYVYFDTGIPGIHFKTVYSLYYVRLVRGGQ